MNVTAKSEYAVRALVELAQRSTGEPVSLVSLAQARGIPAQFLEQLFATLRRAGMLRSHRGVHGGFSFNRPPEDITVLDVVRALDGPIAPALCTTSEPCEQQPGCSVGDVWLRVKVALEEVLGGVTIEELAAAERGE